MDPDVRRILIINGKGGCGKTTIATNLAVAYAARGQNVALVDNDPQGSSTHWADMRSEHLAPVHMVAAHQRAHMYETRAFHNRLPAHIDRIIVDGHSNARDKDLDELLRLTDVVLIPLLPSAIDMHAGGRFITDLLTHRNFRQHPRPIGIIANRVQPNTPTHEKLQHFLACLDVPTVATFRDSPVYTEAAATGQGVVDMRECRAARKETASWWQLLDWLDQQGKAARVTLRELRQRPLAAGRHEESQETSSAEA